MLTQVGDIINSWKLYLQSCKVFIKAFLGAGEKKESDYTANLHNVNLLPSL